MVKDYSKFFEFTMFSQEEVYLINNSPSGWPVLDFIHLLTTQAVFNQWFLASCWALGLDEQDTEGFFPP